MVKKKGAFLISASLALSLSLTACASPVESLHRHILLKSGIEETEDYKTAQMFKNTGQLDSEGKYIIPLEQDTKAEASADGTVQVNFGRNSYLESFYFLDEEMSNAIKADAVSLKPGESIYVSESVNNNPHSNLYRLHEYRIYEYSADGKLLDEDSVIPSKDNLLFTVPNNAKDRSFSIMPVGIYPERQLFMTVFYTDDNGKTYSLESAGKWTVNEAPCDNKSVNISSVDSYVLKFDFDEENYFFVNSSPECFTKSPNQAGFVEFFEENPTECETDEYIVELCEYLSLKIKSDADATVSVNGGESNEARKNKYYDLNKIKYGDSIIVETAGKLKVSGDDKHVVIHKDPIGGRFRYTIDVSRESHSNDQEELPENVIVNRQFTVNLDTGCPHAECVFELDGKEVCGEISLMEDQQLVLHGKIEDEGYIFAEKIDVPWYKSKTRIEKEIAITPELNNRTLIAGDYLDIIKKEDK